MYSYRPFRKQTQDSIETSLVVELIANLKARYRKRIGSKLAGRFPVNLRIPFSNKGTSEETAQNFITLQDEQVGHEIGEIFDRAHGRLLVVGLPGAGKTTLLLQLAVELLDRAERVAHLQGVPLAEPAIPVLLNLATWRSEFNTFDEWLKRILPNELGASRALTEKIRANIPLILLLDGLDEVPIDDRLSCLEALGQYGMKPECQFVVSTRIDEYAATKDAPVYSQVEVAPLTAEQIEQNLIAYSGLAPEAKPLLNAIRKDPLLKQAIENPFYLNTAQLLFASGKNWSEFGFVANDVEGRQGELVGRFVEYALMSKVKQDYEADKLKKWLKFLAWKMEERKLNTFELADLQMNWIVQGTIYKVFSIFNGAFLIFTLVFLASYIANFFGFKTPQIALAIFALLIILREIGIHFSTVKVRWSWERFKPSEFMGSFIWILILLLMEMTNAYDFWKAYAWIMILATSYFTVLSGFYYYFDISITHPYKRFLYSLKFLNFSIVSHFIRRFLLAIKLFLPFRLVRFLNEMSRRHLLEFDGDLDTETGGGAWRWRHRIIQEYFLLVR